MSESIAGNVKPVLVGDRRLNFAEEVKFGVHQSGTQNTYQPVPTQTFSGSTIIFAAQPPSPSTAINRELLIQAQFVLNFTGQAGSNGRLLNLGTFDAPRFMPMAQITSTLTAQINTQNVSMNNYQAVNALFRCNLPDIKFKTDLSTAPSMLDFYQNYDDAYEYVNFNPNFPAGYTSSPGVTVDPLSNIGQGSQGFVPRGGFMMDSYTDTLVAVGADTTAQVVFTTTEPLIVSPFLSGTDDAKSFFGVQQLNLTFTLLGDLSRVWSHNGTNVNSGTITSITADFNTNPQLLVNYITPAYIEEIPKAISYNYSDIQIYSNNVGNIDSGASMIFTANNIQLSNIPKRILLFARRRDADVTFETSDVFANISNINILFDNVSGILSSATEQQIYEFSRNSGLNMSWPQYHQYTGSIVVIDIPRTLMLKNPTEAPSVATTKQLQVTATINNINGAETVNFYFYIMVISDGLMTIEDQTTFTQSSVLTPNDILKAKEGPTYSWARADEWSGGSSFLSRLATKTKKGLKEFGHKAEEGLKDVGKAFAKSGIISQELAKYSPEVATAALALGLGHGGARASNRQLLGYK